MRSLCAVALLACVLATAAAANDFHGKAQPLMPTPKEIGFARVIQFKPAKKPSSNLSRGWKGGVAAVYAKSAAKTPVEALATVYVYGSEALAKAALQNACPKCARVRGQGLRQLALDWIV